MHPGYFLSIANMETSKCEDTEDESILEVSEFDWATYLGGIQYLRRQNIGLFWPPTYLNVDNIYPNALSFYGSKMILDGHQWFRVGLIRFVRVQIILDRSKLQKIVQKNLIWTSPKWFGHIQNELDLTKTSLNVEENGYFLDHLLTHLILTTYILNDPLDNCNNVEASPESAFCHVEASLDTGVKEGMIVEKPLDSTNQTFWLASIDSVFGPLLKLTWLGDEQLVEIWHDLNKEHLFPLGSVY